MISVDQTRILYVLKLLEIHSDENHPLSAQQIIQLLEENYHITAHRTTIYKVIDALKNFGIDIVTVRSTQNLYFIGNRCLEIPEMRLLIDAICSSKCLTEKKSRELIDKLLTLVSTHQADVLRERAVTDDLSKPSNEQIYYIIDAVERAIETDKIIHFTYTEYTATKERVLRGDGEVYTLSPYACIWNGDCYYVVGWSDKHQNISTFRIDRIACVPQIGAESRIAPPPDFRIAQYSKSVFSMFKGELTAVELLCENDMMKTVIDRFSENVQTKVFDDFHFTATVFVELSPTFYGWVFEFGGKIRILSPQNAVDEMSAMLHAFDQ